MGKFGLYHPKMYFIKKYKRKTHNQDKQNMTKRPKRTQKNRLKLLSSRSPRRASPAGSFIHIVVCRGFA